MSNFSKRVLSITIVIANTKCVPPNHVLTRAIESRARTYNNNNNNRLAKVNRPVVFIFIYIPFTSRFVNGRVRFFPVW